MGNSSMVISPERTDRPVYKYEEEIIMKHVLDDLKNRSGPSGQIMSYEFKEYFGLTFAWSERILRGITAMKSGFGNYDDIHSKLASFALGSFDERAKLLFKIFDCNRSGYVEKEEFAQMLAYMPDDLTIERSYCKELDTAKDHSSLLYNIRLGSDKDSGTVLSKENVHEHLEMIVERFIETSAGHPAIRLQYSEFITFLQKNMGIIDYLVWTFRTPISLPLLEIGASIEDKITSLKSAKNVCCGLCHYENPIRWERFYSLFFHGCTKQGEMLLDDEKKGISTPVTLFQREDFLYILPLNCRKIKSVIRLKNIVASQRKGKSIEDRGFELIYDGSEATVTTKFFSTNEEETEGWINSINLYNGIEKVFEKYQVGDEIGRGNVAILSDCIDLSTKRELVVKSIEKAKLKQQDRRYLNNEMAISKELYHKNIARCYDVIETRTYTYIIMEKVAGGELFDLIQQKKFFSEMDTCYILYYTLMALSYLHSSGIMHRDIKPENILVEFSQNKEHVTKVKLIDFGLASMLRPNELLHDPCGTPTYVAPEVIKKQGYDEKADMWSIGIIAYLMLRGQMPFNTENIKDFLDSIALAEIPYDDAWKGFSPECLDFVKSLLNINPKLRMSSHQAIKHPWIIKNKSRFPPEPHS